MTVKNVIDSAGSMTDTKHIKHDERIEFVSTL